ncbi:NACHT domain-containing protein [Pseudooceanicola sp. HF7]|uniref:NACHT domain-containing protein n=1 Tax=Pseudooceanicola sp. HF7 TaxID=2721560 RepID=UPI00142F4124|nr:NACHT domain-containing protein [Pseudooceanicola sp. HF7]NIZ11111.1 NACHT domain-containing protein [Pseudooceanicola sp. HF7]
MAPDKLTPKDLRPFADIGTSVEVIEAGFMLTSNERPITVSRENAGYEVSADGQTRRYTSAGAVLASPVFADLSKVARNQVALLAPKRMIGRPVPITCQMKVVEGRVPGWSNQVKPWESLNDWLRDVPSSRRPGGTDFLLIDGPAGVGKTTIVREAALSRAESYDGSAPLILQVVSRGRVLQNIPDLIAFALQDVRSNLTVNQLIVLMRHGLVTLAIDGFDELSDPNGFETAWSGLNGLIEEARGSATLLLAGRETFVSTDTIRKQLSSFSANRDRLAALSLTDPDPDAARAWLLEQDGWSHTLLDKEFVEPIFDSGSFALRPFFLHLISLEPDALASDELPASDLLTYLVDTMTRREATKFVEALDPPDGSEATAKYELYVGRFLEEVARDLAENQSEAINDDALDLLARVAADGLLPDDQIAAVAQRARTVVFLANDLRAGDVRFAHEQLQQHFLAREALRSVGEGEIPRYVRRNLFGREALDVFGHVARGKGEEANRFLIAVRKQLASPSRDRTSINLAVLGVAAACAVVLKDADLQIRDIGIGELHFPFAAPDGISFRGTTISILYAAGADLQNVHFNDGVVIVTLEIDARTLLPSPIPLPQILVGPEGTTADGSVIRGTLSPEGVVNDPTKFVWSESLAELLGRIDRYRAFWLRTNIDDTDPPGRRIIAHPDWDRVFAALKEFDLVTVRNRQASGAWAAFVHFRKDISLVEHPDLYRKLMPSGVEG